MTWKVLLSRPIIMSFPLLLHLWLTVVCTQFRNETQNQCGNSGQKEHILEICTTSGVSNNCGQLWYESVALFVAFFAKKNLKQNKNKKNAANWIAAIRETCSYWIQVKICHATWIRSHTVHKAFWQIDMSEEKGPICHVNSHLASLDDAICEHMYKHVSACVCESISAYQSVHWLYVPVSLCTFPNSLLFIVGLKHCFISHPARLRVGVHELAVRQASQVSPAALCFCECVHVALEVQLHVTYRSSEQHLVSGLFFVCSVSPESSDVCLALCARGEHEKGRERSRFAPNKVADCLLGW